MAESRFLTLADVADVLNISASQTYALVRNKQLEAIKIGGRGQWRVSETAYQDYVQAQYTATKDFIDKHPFEPADRSEDEDEDAPS